MRETGRSQFLTAIPLSRRHVDHPIDHSIFFFRYLGHFPANLCVRFSEDILIFDILIFAGNMNTAFLIQMQTRTR